MKYVKFKRNGKIVYAIATDEIFYGKWCLLYIKNGPSFFRKTDTIAEVLEEEYLAATIMES